LVASNLLDIITAGLDQPNLPLIQITVKILKSILEADKLRLQDIYAEDFNDHITALDHFVHGWECLLEAYKPTMFKDSLGTLDTFLGDEPDWTL
jgi:hypothetical protein